MQLRLEPVGLLSGSDRLLYLPTRMDIDNCCKWKTCILLRDTAAGTGVEVTSVANRKVAVGKGSRVSGMGERGVREQ
jgi:hypothetical protein